MPTVTGRATDFITFSRTSNATVTGADGRIRWAGHNLLTNSESFDASAWTKTAGAVIVPNTAVAPNGTSTADFIRETAATTSFAAYQNVSNIPASVNHTAQVFLKANGRNFANVAWLNNQGTDRWAIATFSLTGSGSVTKTGNGAAGTYVTSSITPLSDGWYLCSITASHAFTAGTMVVSPSDSGTPTYSTYADVIYAGNATLGVLAWGAHLYRSDLGGMVLNPARGDAYYPTTPRNLVGYSEDVNQWTKTALSVISNAEIAPNGIQAADKIVASATSGYHGIAYGITIGAAPHTFSFYAKAAEYSRVWVGEGGNGFFCVGFDLAANQIVPGTGSGSKYISAAIQPAGNGWYRCSVLFSNVSAGMFPGIVGYPNTGATTVGFGAQYTGDGVSGVYVWGAQLSDSASLDAYSPVYGAAVTSAAYYAPRLDFDPVTLAARGLLVEEQRTNLLLRSSEFNATPSWFPFGSSVTANTSVTVAPDGTLTADKIVEDGNTSQHGVYQSIATTATSHTFSVYAKAAERSFIYIQCDNPVVGQYYNLSDGTLGNSTGSPVSTITAVGNGWYRCTMTLTAVAATPAFYIILASANGTTGYAGNGLSGAFVWGAQLEIGASGAAAPFATSYIPTGASTATRTADVASVSTQAFPFNSNEGSIVANGSVIATTANNRAIFNLFTSQTQFIVIGNNTTGIGGTLADFYVINSTNQAVLTFSGAVSAGTPFKVSGAYKANDFAASANGAAAATDTSGSVPPVSIAYIGQAPGGNFFNGWVRQITYIPRRLSNSELQARTV